MAESRLEAQDAWRVPLGSLIAAAVTVVAAGMAMMLWMMFVGMGHGARSTARGIDLLWYTGIVLLFGAAWLFIDAGGDVRHAPPAARTTLVRIIGMVCYLFATACVAIGGWALLAIVMSW